MAHVKKALRPEDAIKEYFQYQACALQLDYSSSTSLILLAAVPECRNPGVCDDDSSTDGSCHRLALFGQFGFGQFLERTNAQGPEKMGRRC